MEIRRLTRDHVADVIAAGDLFDALPRRAWTEQFLAREGHHMLLGVVDGTAVGFVTGIEITHPDKGTEMLLYELAVDEQHRRRGYGRALVEALRTIATDLGCYDMWVPIEPDNDPAIATYRSTGGGSPEPAAIQVWQLPRSGAGDA